MVPRRFSHGNLFVVFWCLFFAFGRVFPAWGNVSAPLRIIDVTVEEQRGVCRVDVVFSGRPDPAVVVSGDEDLLVWDFEPAIYPETRRRVGLSGVFARDVVIAQNDRNRVRLALRRVRRGDSLLDYRVVEMDRSGTYAFRVEMRPVRPPIDETAFPPGLAMPSVGSSFAGPRSTEGDRRWVVVIDPGHGGRDPGATAGGVQEKDIVLDVAHEVAAALRRVPHIDVRMTRTDDTFVRLGERSRLASAWNADLFVSLHCNAISNTDTSGFEVYTLSPDGATDEVAREVAAAENSVLVLEGIDPNTQEASILSQILCSMLMTDTMNQSVLLAGFIGRAVTGLPGLVNRGHRRANFYVLRLLQVPSVLVELGFITNPDERRRMTNRSFHVGMGRRLAEGITRYVAYVQMREGEFAHLATEAYRVEAGDTLASIARNHRTTINELIRLNGLLNADTIMVGQELRVPLDPITELLGRTTE